MKFLITALLLPLSAHAVTLARDGRSTYSIVLPRPALPSEERAASELQKYLEEMSGARLPIVAKCASKTCILLQPDAGAMGAEESRLRTDGKHLIISGGRPRGVMYGVYGLLDKLGCRWYTSTVSRIPKRRTIELPALNQTLKPDFEYREPFYTEAFEKEWAAHNRVNGNSMHLDESTGGRFAYYPFVHSFNTLVPPEKYFATHPEYFSQVDGKRRASQLCLTNPEVLRIATEQVFEWIRQHPEASIYTVSQNDGRGWCECDRCMKLTAEEGGRNSGPILHFVNAVAEQVERKYPGRLIDTLAYYYTDDPPLKVRPRPNVRVRLCPIGNCQAHRYDDPRCTHNQPFMKMLKAWSQITQQLYIWHYNTNFQHFIMPFPNLDEFMSDIPLYKRNGVVGVFLEGSYGTGGGGEFAELKSWVMARLLWDTRADGSKLVDEFLEAVYGKAAPYLRAYLDRLQREVRFAPEGRGVHLWIDGMPELSAAFVTDGKELFRKAEAAADNDDIRRRIRHQRMQVEYMELQRERAFSVNGSSYEPRDAAGTRARFEELFKTMRSFGIQMLREGGPIAWHEEQVRTYTRPFALNSLEDATARVDFAPGLAGRAVRWIHKPTGLDLMRDLDPGSPDYPNIGGLQVMLTDDFRGKEFPITWSVEPGASAGRIAFAGTTAQGLTVERTVSLEAGKLRTHTAVKNSGAEARELVLRTRGEFRTTALRWAMRKPGGAMEPESLLTPGGPTNGLKTFWADERPDGEWSVLYPEQGLALVNRFVRAQTGQCIMGWTDKDRKRISLTLFTPRTTLKPGETLQLDSDYVVERMK